MKMKKSFKEWCIENNCEELLKQWLVEENLPLTPDSVSYGCDKYVKWKCHECEHVWETKIGVRTARITKCPICARKIRNEKMLQTKIEKLGSLEARYPEIMKQWDYTKNNILPSQVLPKSNQKAWWICNECGFSYLQRIESKVRGLGCPNCKQKNRIKTMVSKHGSLLSVAPHFENEWSPNKNNGLTIAEMTPSSNKKVWWRCSNGHEWEASPATRLRGHGCPFCSGRKVTRENSLAIKNPELAKEWNYKRNKKLTPYDVSCGSERKVWWICTNGHEWQQTVCNRNAGRGCSKCSAELKTSFPEQAIYYYLSKCVKLESRMKINGWEADLFLPEYNIAIEYDGIVYHSKDFVKEREIKKNKAFGEKNIFLIRVKESWDIEKIEENVVYFKVDGRYTRLQNGILLLFEIIEQQTGIKINLNIDIEKDKLDIISQYYKMDKKNNFAEVYPDLVRFWNYEKNNRLKPENFRSKSNESVWWKCPICNGEWKSTINNIAKGNRCPYCSGHRVLKGYNDLETLNPSLVEEWNFEKNTLKPSEITVGSGKKVWWICKKCGNEWKAGVSYRSKHSLCPKCYHNKVRDNTNYYNNERWMQMYEYAKKYYEQNGNLEIPAQYICEGNIKLGSWIRTQRINYQNEELKEERKKLLEKIGMKWKIKNKRKI